jgi:nitrogen regulatory protein PII
MRMFLIIYDAELDEEVLHLLNECGVTGFTKWDRVLGKGRESPPKMDDAVWPGFNCAIALSAEDHLADRILDKMAKFAERLGGKGFKLFELPLIREI